VNKFKTILLFLVLVVLVDFAVENRSLPPPELKLFSFSLGQVPVFLLFYASLALGLLVGWVGHVLRLRKKKKQAIAALTQEEQTKGA